MTKELFEINRRGELINPTLLGDLSEKYKPDSPFLRGIVPYLIMLLCGFIDGCFFYSLFSLISYDRPFLLWVQIIGFIFGFDCIPVFLGIHYKKLKQGLSKDRFTFRLALGVCALICTANIGLRAVTVDLMSPDLSDNSQSYFGDASENTEETAEAPDAVAWMMAITGMVVPIVTSVGSFYISNLCYDPLLIRMQREEKMICRNTDKIRRLYTMNCAYKADQSVEKRLLEDDEQKYVAARKKTIGLLLEDFDYISQKLMARVQNPASISMLSMSSDRDAFLKELNQRCIQANNYAAMPAPSQGTGD